MLGCFANSRKSKKAFGVTETMSFFCTRIFDISRTKKYFDQNFTIKEEFNIYD